MYKRQEYHKGTLAGKQVVVCCAGMGKANAATDPGIVLTVDAVLKLCLLYTSRCV